MNTFAYNYVIKIILGHPILLAVPVLKFCEIGSNVIVFHSLLEYHWFGENQKTTLMINIIVLRRTFQVKKKKKTTHLFKSTF